MFGLEFLDEEQHKFAFFTACMESIGYQTILERNLLPFVRKIYPDGHYMCSIITKRHEQLNKKMDESQWY